MMNRMGKPAKNPRRPWTTSLGVALLALCLPSLTLAVPTVYIEPESTVVDTGDVFDVRVMISADADTFSNFRLFFRFDTQVIDFLGATEGSLYVNVLPGFWTWFGVEEESVGTWEAFDNVFPSGSYVVAPGELVRFSFEALAPGESPIEFLSVSVKDVDRFPLDPLEWEDGHVTVGDLTAVEAQDLAVQDWDLSFPFPNPSRGTTQISLAAPAERLTTGHHLAVYDVHGRLVRDLTDPFSKTTDLLWDGRDGQGIRVPSGVYFFRLMTAERAIARKVVLIR